MVVEAVSDMGDPRSHRRSTSSSISSPTETAGLRCPPACPAPCSPSPSRSPCHPHRTGSPSRRPPGMRPSLVPLPSPSPHRAPRPPLPRHPRDCASPLPNLPPAASPLPRSLFPSRGARGSGGAWPGLPIVSPLSAAATLVGLLKRREEKKKKTEERRGKKKRERRNEGPHFFSYSLTCGPHDFFYFYFVDYDATQRNQRSHGTQIAWFFIVKG